MFPQFKSFEALQTVKSSIVSLCMIFKSIFEDSKVSYLIETKGLPIAFAQVLRIYQLYNSFRFKNIFHIFENEYEKEEIERNAFYPPLSFDFTA